MVFDLSKPAAKAVKSPMGGGWIVPLNETGKRALTHYYGYAPQPIAPLGGERGWIVEPQDSEDLANYLHGEKLAWIVQ